MRKNILALFLALFPVALYAAFDRIELCSPSGSACVGVWSGPEGTFWDLSVGGNKVILPSALGLELRGKKPFRETVAKNVSRHQSDTKWTTRFYKKETVRDNFNELSLDFVSVDDPTLRLGFILRAYDNAIAFRYVIPGSGKFVIEKELTCWTFDGDPMAWLTVYRSPATSQEEWYLHRTLKTVGDFGRHFNEEFLVGSPAVVEVGSRYLAVCEAALVKWAGMFLAIDSYPGDRTALCARPAPRKDNIGLVAGRAPAKSPWRVVAIADNAAQLCSVSDVLRNLNPPPEGGEEAFDWVRPGVSSWDWWANSNHELAYEGVQFEKRSVDFAAEMGWPYHLVDAGWYGRPNNGETVELEPVPEFDMQGLLSYAKEKGVGIFLWMHWRTLQANGIDATFAKFAKWGIAGVKIDYMNRMDQEMVQWYEKVVKSAAKHKLIVNYHGSFVPTGTERTWPNNLTRESVLGNEMNKFNARCNPRHHATLPFTRFILGAADFTPGGFDNLHSCEFESQGRRGHDCLDFSPSSDKPKIMAQEIGTRAHALALTVAYDSPLMTLCDLPERYRGQRGVEALRSLPTVWRNTKVVSGEIGSNFALVRETFDGAFYFAAISVKARRQSLDLSFLGNGEWEMTSYSDDPLRSTSDAKAISINARKVTSGETVFFDIVDEGGAVAIFRRVEPK
ncbi:MAG: glycoside hydrolase family 97 catalytic domain-containing protein [Kiritimatiellae bacterium]|nr:glycoside hydrolase family 97 catalytic domain-containing protein [Kiritimatiellia bacterium]